MLFETKACLQWQNYLWLGIEVTSMTSSDFTRRFGQWWTRKAEKKVQYTSNIFSRNKWYFELSPSWENLQHEPFINPWSGKQYSQLYCLGHIQSHWPWKWKCLDSRTQRSANFVANWRRDLLIVPIWIKHNHGDIYAGVWFEAFGK